ncbi:Outer membrane efflux protein [Virgibacillus subterraneus]|uniref:Outer membrane efflux protein n=1 Tax=Virgibacillus subterraneus TaxID=621109 RepID=A0A1H9EF88_9BACI|nr:hypothetical protein [Virgibacillus subterraneus]SEQ24390.1 Outer membrane efflux protein [Virgibacillus subterraneus]
MGKIKSLFKTKWFWGISITVLVLFISMFGIHNVGYSKGQDSLTAEINEEALNYEQIQEKVGEAEQILADFNNEIETAESDLKTIEDKVAKNQDKFDELQKLASNRDELQNEVSVAESELTGLQSDIKVTENKLAKLEGDLVAAKEKPIEVGAGQFVFGEDIKPGRYKVTPIGRGSNFSVWDADGGLVLSTILGDGGVPSYVFVGSSGYKVKNAVPVKLTPVE